MSQSVESQRFAALMRTFKNRTDRSYEALANRIGISSSSLHRYCSGTKIPADYGAVQRFAKECGATPPELRDLHRLWALADANRNTQPAVRQEFTAIPVAPVQRVSPLVVAGAAMLAVVAWRVMSGKQRQQV